MYNQYQYYQPQPYDRDILYKMVLEKLTNGLIVAALTAAITVYLGVPPIFLILAIVGYIVSIIGYFFAKNENTINNLYFIFVGSSSVFLGTTFSVLLAVDGGAEIIMGSFGITALVVGYIWNKVQVERPDAAYVGRNLTKYSLIFIALLILGWFIAFSGIFYLFISIFGAVLFSMYFYYDLARLMQGQLRSPARMAWNLYWDILLIFKYIMRILLYFSNINRR